MHDSIECVKAIKTSPNVIEIFKTTVRTKRMARIIITDLIRTFPNAKINFDLDDCDKILRIDCNRLIIDEVIETVNRRGFDCEVLE